MRRIVIVVALVLVLAVVGAGILLASLDVNQYRGKIQSTLQEHLHRSVTLGALGLKFIPLAIRVEDTSIGDDPAFDSKDAFLSAKEMYVSVSLPALLARQVRVDSLRVIQPQVHLIKNRQGKWNFESLTSGASPSGSSSGSGGTAVALGELTIQDGTVAVTDQTAGKGTGKYDHIDITLKDWAPGKHFDLDGKIHLPGGGKELIVVQATGASASDVSGTVSLQTVSLAGLRTFLGASAAELSDVVLNGDSKFQDQGGAMSAQGSVSITDSMLKEPGHLDFNVKDDRQSGVLEVPSFTAKLGSVTVTGSAQTKLNPDTVDARIRTDNASIAEFLRLAKMAGFAPGFAGTGTLSMNIRAQGSPASPAIGGSVSVRNASVTLPAQTQPVQVDSADIRFAETRPVSANGSGTVTIGKISYNELVLTDVKGECKVSGGIIEVNPLTANLFGGSETGAFTIDLHAVPPKYTVNSKLSSVDANKLISATSAMKNVFYGTVNESTDIQLNPIAGQDMARGLNGTIDMVLVNGKLTGISVMNEMAKVGKFLGYAIVKDNTTNIQKMSGTFKIQDGVANSDNLQMAFDGGSLTGAGTIGLVDQTLNLKLTTVLTKDKTQHVSANMIGGMISTVMSNSKGELVVPATVKGTFAKPQFEPDTAQMARMKLGSLVPTKSNPGGAPETAVKGILGALKKK